VNWFRKHLKHGSRLALLALAIQFVVSFGHFHAEVARAAPALQASLTEVVQQPSNHDTDRHITDCAICAVISLANNFLSATPPSLELPQAVEIQHVASGAAFAHLGSLDLPFQSRAPPVS
jgi:hypothetical protein